MATDLGQFPFAAVMIADAVVDCLDGGETGPVLAIGLVADQPTKARPDEALPRRVHKRACAAGAMVRVSAPNIILSPPLILSDTEEQIILDALEAGLRRL